jgi:multidrug efflux pump subunit AcrA (membrane-fusion protein)
MNRESSMQASDTLIVVDRSRRRRTIIIAALVAVAALLIAAYFFSGSNGAAEEAAKGPGAGGGQVPTVSVVVPGRTEVGRTITASGALAARRDQPIGVAGEGGRVTNVYVDAGSWVGQGQVLASIDRSVQTQETAQLAASVQAARADAALAQNELERSQALVGRGFVSKADLDR